RTRCASSAPTSSTSSSDTSSRRQPRGGVLRVRRRKRPPGDDRQQRDAAGRRHAGAAHHLHGHRAAHPERRQGGPPPRAGAAEGADQPVTEAPQTVYRSLLGGDPRIGWLGPGLALALALHAAVVAAAFFLPRFLDRPRPLRKPVIAHLVALGKPRDPRLMPRK